jgi:glycosyl transferase family 25
MFMSHHIDKIIFINLQERTDRRREIEAELDRFGLSYERFEAISTPEFGALGCSQSHLAVMKWAKQQGYETILILEDDFQFVVSKEEWEHELSGFFEEKIPFDVCMVSYAIYGSQDVGHKHVHKLLQSQTSSGYLLHRRYYDTLISFYEEVNANLEKTKNPMYIFDQAWKRIQPQHDWYYFKKRLGKQRPSFSNITGRVENYQC